MKLRQHPSIRHRPAIGAVAHAIKKGLLKRAECCEICGIRTEAMHAHHDDYNKFLEVRWLCIPCHRKWHWRNVAIPYDDSRDRAGAEWVKKACTTVVQGVMLKLCIPSKSSAPPLKK